MLPGDVENSANHQPPVRSRDSTTLPVPSSAPAPNRIRTLWVALLAFTGLLGAYPTARALGRLPSPTAWEARGMNHGPWHYSGWAWLLAAGLFGCAPLVAAGPIIGAVVARETRDRRAIYHGMAVALLAACLLALFGRFAFWAVD